MSLDTTQSAVLRQEVLAERHAELEEAAKSNQEKVEKRRAELEEKFGINQPVIVRADELLEIESPTELGVRLSDVEKGVNTLLQNGDTKAVKMSVNQLTHTAKMLAEKNKDLSFQLQQLRRELGLSNLAEEQRAFIRKRF